MDFSYCLSGATPIIRDVPLYDASSILDGEALTYGATTRGSLLISSANTGVDFAGVAQETIVASTTDLTAGVIVYGKACIQPDAIYKTLYDDAAANDVDVVSSTSTATTLGATDDDMDGGWMYVNSGTGVGQLAYIGAASTTVMTLSTQAAWTVTPDSTSDVLLIRRLWRAPADSGINLDSTGRFIDSGEAATGRLMAIENYIASQKHPEWTHLRPSEHHMLTGLQNNTVRFAADLFPVEHLLGTTAQD